MTSARDQFLAAARGCKIGTIPATVIVHGTDAKALAPGKRIRVRERPGARWTCVTVTEVHPDGYFKADR